MRVGCVSWLIFFRRAHTNESGHDVTPPIVDPNRAYLDVHRGGIGRDDAWRLLQHARGHHAVEDIVLCFRFC